MKGKPQSQDQAQMTKTLREQQGYWADPELAAFLGITVGSLKNRRWLGDLPPASKVGKDNLTRIVDAQRYVAQRRRSGRAA